MSTWGENLDFEEVALIWAAVPTSCSPARLLGGLVGSSFFAPFHSVSLTPATLPDVPSWTVIALIASVRVDIEVEVRVAILECEN